MQMSWGCQTNRERERERSNSTHSRDCCLWVLPDIWQSQEGREAPTRGGREGTAARSARIGAPFNCCLNLHFKLVSNSAAELSSGSYTYTATAEDTHIHDTHIQTHTHNTQTEADSVRKAKVSRSTPFHFQGRVIDIRLSRTHYTHVGKHTHTHAYECIRAATHSQIRN